MRRSFPCAILLALILTLSIAISAFAESLAPVTDLRAQKSGTSVILTWTHSDAAWTTTKCGGATAPTP